MTTWDWFVLLLLIILFCLGIKGGQRLMSVQTGEDSTLMQPPEAMLIRPGIGVAFIQGRRPHMEDTFTVDEHALGGKNCTFVGVFDGHGGDEASTFLKYNLHATFVETCGHDCADVSRALFKGFQKCERELLRNSQDGGWLGGSTAICSLICGEKLFVANVGDSRAVLSSNGFVIPLSIDHKPSNDEEKARIESSGGRVVHVFGTWRVEGILAITRAFGDRHLKRYVKADPEIISRDLAATDEFIIMASDGLWDVISSQDAVNMVRGTDYAQSPHLSASRLVESAYQRGSMDNITVIVIDLRSHHI